MVGTHNASTLPSLCLRSAFAPKVEAKGTQKGMKKTSTSPLRLSDDTKMN